MVDAKLEIDLVTYCKKQNVPYTTFENFHEILGTVKRIVSGETSVKEVAARG
jgi:2-hydroxy-3-keto-5-methylthiopentenyl-1-phosphate phosphatase